jgi:outer membrane protein TolC
MGRDSSWRRLRRLLAEIALFSVVFPGCSAAVHAPPAPAAERISAYAPAPMMLTTLDLEDCLRTARERSPRLATQRASLAGVEDAKRALDNLRLPGNLSPQVPYRRRQACLGLSAAAAGMDKSEREVAYAVTRAYLTVLYAREQERVANTVVERLKAVQQTAQQGLELGVRDVTATDVQRTKVYLRLAETKLTQATQGVKRALASLREAIGFGPEALIDVPAGNLPEPIAYPNRDEVVAAALSRRAELIQAQIFAQVAALEVEAQATSHSQRMSTFAAGTDIHSLQVPQENRGNDYRPGAVPPEMPTLLVGSRAERIKHARVLCARAEGVVETSRNLIALEVEDAFLRWEEASAQAQKAKEAAEEGEKLAAGLVKDLTAGLKVRIDEVVTAQVLGSTARSEYNEFLYKQLLALADLERATAGCFAAGIATPGMRTIKTGPELVPDKK